jgi:hypothetical protein
MKKNHRRRQFRAAILPNGWPACNLQQAPAGVFWKQSPAKKERGFANKRSVLMPQPAAAYI